MVYLFTGRCIRHRFDYGAIIFLGNYKISLLNLIKTFCSIQLW